MIQKLCKLYHTYQEAIDYLFWGGMTTVVSWGSYSLFVLLLQGLDSVVFWANILSWVCAVLFAFITNKLWVFQSKSWAAGILFPELTKFLSSRVATGVFEMIAVPALVAIGLKQTIFGIDGMVSKILVSVVVVILNYILSKLFVFKNK